MTELSIFQNFNKVVENKTFDTIAEIIRSGKFKGPIEKLQTLLKEGKDKEYAAKKKSLLAFTPSAQYKGGRKAEFLEEYSKIIILDIDKLENNLQKFRTKAIKCKFTYSCFISPSGKGLKILVRTENSVTKHLETFLKVQAYYEKLLGIKIDPSGKDVSRLCFFSYDKDIYHNKESENFKTEIPMSIKSDIEKLIEQIEGNRIDITSNYDDWIKIGFAIESEFGESGRHYFHAISKLNHDYSAEHCNEQYSKCLKNNNSGITIKTLFHFAKQNGIVIKSLNKRVTQKVTKKVKTEIKEDKKITANKFNITEEYLKQRYEIRYNTVSNKFEYKEKGTNEYEDLNENNLYVKLQKDNINLSLNNLVALLKSDFVNRHDPFLEYFERLPDWDEENDYVEHLCSFIKVKDQERFNHHFLKWLVRTVKTATEKNSYNKQAFVLVSNHQNSGKSTFCRFLCPKTLSGYIAENIGTDKDSHVAITENFLINLDELSQAEKAEINAFKSMFSKDKVKARLTYDKRASVHIRRASFIGSTDKWEFLTDENGSVRWLCMEVDYIDWNYSKDVDMDKVYAQIWYLVKDKDFVFDLTREEIAENDKINKKFQISTPESDLVDRFFAPSNNEQTDLFYNATEILEYIMSRTSVKLLPEKVGKALRYLDFERIARKIKGKVKHGYWVKILNSNNLKNEH